MEDQRLIALEQKVAALEQRLEDQQQAFNNCTENLVSDIRYIGKYFNCAIPELITVIRVLRREI